MEQRHLRNIPALTEAEQTLLAGKTVAVVGCGGLGGYLVELLCRIGVGGIRAVDCDAFEMSNLNRQILATMDTLGCSKAAAAAQRVQQIDPGVRVQAFHVVLDDSNARELIRGCDAVLDALDSIGARRILAAACEAEGIPYLHGAISGWVAQAAVSMPGDGLIDRLYPPETILSDRSVLSFTPALCAAMQTSMCIKLLTGRPMETGQICYFDLLSQEYAQIPMIL